MWSCSMNWGTPLASPISGVPTTYQGIMRQDLSMPYMTTSDQDLLHKIYESHAPGQGW